MNHQEQGTRAKHIGKLFEGIFERACASVRVPCTRMPDGCQQRGPKLLVRVKTPLDYIVTYMSRTALLDTKTTEGDSFPHSKIEKHQVEPMLSHERAGSVGGYLIWIRGVSKVIFVPASILVPLMGTRGSIKVGHPGSVVVGSMTETPLAGSLSLSRIFRRNYLIPEDL